MLSQEFLVEFVRSDYTPRNSVQVPASQLNAVRHDGNHAFGMRKGAHCDNGHPTHGLDSVCDAWMLMFCSDPPSAWPRSCVKRHPVSLAISLPLPYGNKDGTCCAPLSGANPAIGTATGEAISFREAAALAKHSALCGFLRLYHKREKRSI